MDRFHAELSPIDCYLLHRREDDTAEAVSLTVYNCGVFGEGEWWYIWAAAAGVWLENWSGLNRLASRSGI